MARYRYLGLDVVHVPALELEFLKPGDEFETEAEVNNPIFELISGSPAPVRAAAASTSEPSTGVEE